MIHATLKVNDIFHRLQALLYSTPGTLLGKRTADKKAIDKTTLDKMTTGLVLIVRAPSTTLEGIGCHLIPHCNHLPTLGLLSREVLKQSSGRGA
jgi:hypothetical protein